MRKANGYVPRYRGYWLVGGKCRIRIYREDGLAPKVICSQHPDNDNTSVGVREAEPAVGVPLEREFGAFGDVEVRRHRFPPGEAELSAEVTEAEGNVMAVPAGVPAWQALFDASEAVNMLLDEDLVGRLAEEAGGDASRVEVLGGPSGHPPVGLAEFLLRYPESHRHLART